MIDHQPINTTPSIDLTYTEAITLNAQLLQLSAYEGKQDVSDALIFEPASLDTIGSHDITVRYQDHETHMLVNLIDTTPPTLTGIDQLDLELGSEFTPELLQLTAMDNAEGDLSDQIACEGVVDVWQAGTYPIMCSVADRSNNRSEWTASITIYEAESTLIDDPTPMSNVQLVADPNAIDVLINKQYHLPDGWAPADLVSFGNGYLRSEAAQSLTQMIDAATADGITLNVVSTYRTQAYQTNLYNNYMASDPTNAPYYSAYPRSSEHELGLAVDVSYDYALHSDLDTSELGQWLAAHAHEYGWLLRYPADKTDITGYYFEAWHYRYLGVDTATLLHDQGLTLEEYAK